MSEDKNIGQKLHAWFEERVPGITDLVISDVERGAKGWSSELYFFNAEWTEDGKRVSNELVVRIDPWRVSEKYYPNSSLGRQFKVLKALKRAKIKVPAPEVLWFEENSRFLGGPFIIMRKLPGKTYVPWSQEGKRFFHTASKSEAPRQYVQMLAELHLLDWEKHGLSFLGVPSNEFEQADQYIDRMEGMLNRNAWQPEPVFRDAIAWARHNRPKMERKAFLHGDYRTGNLLFDKTDIVGVVDWEVSEIGDPNFEIGMICSKINRMDNLLMCYLIDRDFLYSYYEELTGWAVNEKNVLFWEMMYALFDGLFWMIGVKEFVEDKTKDLRKARGFTSYIECKNLVAEYLGY